MAVTIYGLYDENDPRKVIKYVGRTRGVLKQRLYAHRQHAKQHPCNNRGVRDWLIMLAALGSRAAIMALATVADADADAAEAEWVDRKRAEAPLLNVMRPGTRGIRIEEECDDLVWG